MSNKWRRGLRRHTGNVPPKASSPNGENETPPQSGNRSVGVNDQSQNTVTTGSHSAGMPSGGGMSTGSPTGTDPTPVTAKTGADVTANKDKAGGEFVSHLRLINFTLLIVSVGLMVVATQQTAGELRRAIADINSITQIAPECTSGQIKPQEVARPEPFVSVFR